MPKNARTYVKIAMRNNYEIYIFSVSYEPVFFSIEEDLLLI